jgi:S-formylglutathione hydrolase FrmB
MITVAGAGVSQLRRLMFISAAALLALLCGRSASSATSSAWSRQALPGNGEQSDLSAGTKLDASLLESATRIRNKIFQSRYKAKGGRNGVFNFPDDCTHTWSYWGAELEAMNPDLQRVLGAG